MIFGRLSADERPPRVVLSYGMGTDSTALLLHWLMDPSSRDFDLDELVVMTAMTGDEWPATGQLVERHILPLLAEHRVRYVQVARRGPLQRDGVEVLDDSRCPTRLYLDGSYTLAQEMLSAGTIPQTGGARLCSAKAKGWPLDTVIAAITQGQPFRHVLGFEVGEQNRATRDAAHNTELRTGEYPLISWGEDREACENFIRKHLKVDYWVKSACTYCPFALATKEGRRRTAPRFAEDPAAGVLALEMEYVATALNPSQGLIAGDRLHTLLRDAPDQKETLALFQERLHAQPWAVYDVRRAISPRKDGKVNIARYLKKLAVGPWVQMQDRLRELATEHGEPITVGAVGRDDDEHPRTWLHRRGTQAPTVEHFLTVAPAVADDKIGPAFTRSWHEAMQPTLFS